MSEAKISYEDVVAATAHLQARGEPLNPFRLRVVLGRGGFKTIEKHLKRFQQAAAPEEVEAPGSARYQHFWTLAVEEAGQQFEVERADLYQLLEQREAHVAEIEAAMQVEQQRCALAEQRVQDADAERLRLLATLDDERRRSETAQRSVDLSRADLAAASQRFTEAVNAQTASHYRALLQLDHQLQAQQLMLGERLEQWTEQQQRTAMGLREHTSRELEAAVLPLQRELQAAQARVAGMEAQLQNLMEQMARLEHRWSQQRARERKARPLLVASLPRGVRR